MKKITIIQYSAPKVFQSRLLLNFTYSPLTSLRSFFPLSFFSILSRKKKKRGFFLVHFKFCETFPKFSKLEKFLLPLLPKSYPYSQWIELLSIIVQLCTQIQFKSPAPLKLTVLLRLNQKRNLFLPFKRKITSVKTLNFTSTSCLLLTV